MIIKTNGLVLRLDPYSKTSQIITWLTPDHGRIVTLAKGAKRIKSNLLGQYDCFNSCELLFYQSRHSSLHILKECALLTSRPALRSDWRASFTASYLCDLLNRLTPLGSASPPVYLWAENTMDFLAKYGSTETVLNWSELKLLKLLGLSPQLSNCINCWSQEFETGHPLCFSISRGGLLCEKCNRVMDNSILQLDHDILGMLRGWENTDTPAMAKRTVCTPKQAESANKFLSTFIHYHLQASLSRDIVSRLIQ